MVRSQKLALKPIERRHVATELKMNKGLGEVREIPCATCVGNTRHKLIAAADIHGHQDRHGGDWYGWTVENQLFECGGCGSITYRRSSSNSDDTDPEGEAYEDEKLFPPRVSGRKKLQDAWMLDHKVKRIYDETADALAAGSAVLAGIGLRAILETVCKDKAAKGKDLMAKVDALVGKGLLTPPGAAVLHQIRTLGNDAAHEVEPHNEQQLALAMDVIEHLLADVYIIGQKAKRILPAVRS